MTVSDAPQRIGLYGGTFDPPHIGHVRAARNFICAEKLDTLYIMPANIPPHKQIDHADDPIRRFEMCKAAFGDIDGVVVSDYEIVRSGISYTVDTLRHLYDVSGDSVLFMLCGDDMFLTLDRWREPDEIFRMSHIVCMRRYDDGEALIRAKAREYEECFNARVSLIDAPPYPASSTEIRQTVALGGDVSSAVPAQVCDYITVHGMYRD